MLKLHKPARPDYIPKKPILLAIVMAIIGITALRASSASTVAPPTSVGTEKIIIQYKNNGSMSQLQSLFDQLHVSDVANVDLFSMKVLEVPQAQSGAIMNALRANPLIASVSPNVTWHVSTTTPNDGLYNQQWEWPKTATNQLWDKTKGDSKTVVAVLDTGVDAKHPDLANKVLPGYDFFDDDNDPADQNGHGTEVSGVIGAASNNQLGVAGGCWECKILPIKIGGSDGSVTLDLTVQGLEYAVQHGAKVANLSFGGPIAADAVPTLQSAIDQTVSKGVVVVAAAGNEASKTPDYPASYNNVISVAGTGQNDQLDSNSNYGTTVDIAAPWEVRTTHWPGSNYSQTTGTSVSSPVVSAIIGLLASAFPQATVSDLTTAVTTTTDTCCSGKIKGGRINALKAYDSLHAKYPNPTPPPTPPPTTPPPTTPPPTTPPPTTPPPTTEPNPGDINGDGKVNITDMSLLLSAWGTTDSKADLDKSGKVDIRDLSTLLFNWS